MRQNKPWTEFSRVPERFSRRIAGTVRLPILPLVVVNILALREQALRPYNYYQMEQLHGPLFEMAISNMLRKFSVALQQMFQNSWDCADLGINLVKIPWSSAKLWQISFKKLTKFCERLLPFVIVFQIALCLAKIVHTFWKFAKIRNYMKIKCRPWKTLKMLL